MSAEITRPGICLPAGFSPSGRKVRAWCLCGFGTTPRVSRERATAALLAEHGHSDAVCVLCGRDYSSQDLGWVQRQCLRVLTVPGADESVLVCRDMSRSCRDGAAQRQLHLDRKAFDALGAELPRPRLRVVTDHGTDRWGGVW